ncbi:MAG TPA: methyl-accepting chemotaxis protein [Bacillota bacterium]|nr:methyl-accepting chemotaxis protein [Bacillota bacterium]
MKNQKKRILLAIRSKIILGFIILSLLTSCIVGFIIYQEINSYENQKIREEARRMAVIGASMIDGDLHQQIRPGDENTEVYQQFLKKLRQLKKDSGVVYLYTLAPFDSKNLVFVLDTDDSDAQAPIGKKYPYDAEMKETFAGKPSYTEAAYTDEWGTFISGYGPVYNSGGKIVAIVGADFSLQDVKNMERRVMLFIITGIIISVLLSVLLALFISQRISQPIDGALGDLGEGVRKLTAIFPLILGSSQEWVVGNNQIASAISETSASLELSKTMINQNTERTREAASLSSQTKTAADQSNQYMNEMLQSMWDIRKSSEQLAKIIKIIEDIAFQTNILALNAAVEATRAGEFGSGFAVVAEEVRVLAQKSAQAAKDTTDIIENNMSLSENGMGITERLNEILSRINRYAHQVNSLMDEIATESKNQAKGVSQINQAITQVETVIHHHSATAEKGASASRELDAQTTLLKRTLDQLILLVKGAKKHTKNDMR